MLQSPGMSRVFKITSDDTRYYGNCKLMGHKLETNKPLHCPHCNKQLNGATGLTTGNIPNDGDLSVCMYCATPLIFKGKGMDIALYELTTGELAELEEKYNDTYLQIQLIRDHCPGFKKY